MTDDARLMDLVVRWEEFREAGQTLAVEELCRACPELLPALRERLQALGELNAVLADQSTVTAAGSDEEAHRPNLLPALIGAVGRLLGRVLLGRHGWGGRASRSPASDHR